MNISAGSDPECCHLVIIAMVIIKKSSLNPDVSKLASIEGDWQDLVKRKGWECHEHAPLTHHPDPYQLLEYQTDMRSVLRPHIADRSAQAAQTLVIEYLW